MSRSIFQYSHAGDLASRLFQNRHEVEHQLAAGMICDPRRAVPFVLALGITIDDFHADDLRAIAAVAIAAAQREVDREEILALAISTLQERGWWGRTWTERSLRRFFQSEYFCRASLQRNARRLLELARIQKVASQHLFRAADLLMEGACQK